MTILLFWKKRVFLDEEQKNEGPYARPSHPDRRRFSNGQVLLSKSCSTKNHNGSSEEKGYADRIETKKMVYDSPEFDSFEAILGK